MFQYFLRLVHLSLYVGRTPQNMFSYNLAFVSSEYLMFYAEIWRKCCLIIRPKKGVVEFLYFSEGIACFINSQSLQ